jgi:hypothetical protein
VMASGFIKNKQRRCTEQNRVLLLAAQELIKHLCTFSPITVDLVPPTSICWNFEGHAQSKWEDALSIIE